MYTLELTDNKSEIIQYNVPDLPIYCEINACEKGYSIIVVAIWLTKFK